MHYDLGMKRLLYLAEKALCVYFICHAKKSYKRPNA